MPLRGFQVVLVFVCTFSFLAAGCGSSGPEVVPVTGTVTRGDKPVNKLFLNFMPHKGRPSWGVTDQDGHYTLHYEKDRDGAVVGPHKVWVEIRPSSPKEELALQRGTLKLHPEMQKILEKYGKKAAKPLTVEVTADNPVIDLKLD